jgi:hypothetical protein
VDRHIRILLSVLFILLLASPARFAVADEEKNEQNEEQAPEETPAEEPQAEEPQAEEAPAEEAPAEETAAEEEAPKEDEAPAGEADSDGSGEEPAEAEDASSDEGLDWKTRRRLQRNGLFFEKIRYWSDILPTIAQPREPLIVRYDPRDLSNLFVMGKDMRYHSIPYANVTHPPISLGELRHIHALLRSQSKDHIDENMLFSTHEKQQQIVAVATATTKATAGHATASSRCPRPTARWWKSSAAGCRSPSTM